MSAPLIDWVLAGWIARRIAGDDGVPSPAVELASIVADAQERVIAYTGLVPAEPLPTGDAVGRHEWTQANLASMRALIDPLLARASEQLRDRSRPRGLTGRRTDSTAHLALAATSSIEIGVLVGYLGRRVLGQYELALLPEYAEDHPPRLLFVMPNLARAIVNFDADPHEFVTWVALHEATHAVQFSGIPWLQDYLAQLIRSLLESAEQRMTARTRLHLPSRQAVARVARAVLRADLIGIVASAPERELIDRAQAVMAVVEGHAEHVMDAVAPEILPSLPRLRAALDARRQVQSPIGRLLTRLLGMEMKLKQYEQGKRFCDEIVRRSGRDAFEVLFSAPEMLPTLAEIAEPAAWCERVGV